MTSMKSLMLGLSAAALTIGGVACAQAPAKQPRPDETRAEAQSRATEMFARLDVNKDGKLDQADRELMRQQMREKMFAKLDTNGDGSISKAEFMADKGPEGRRGPGGPGMDGPPPPPPGEAGAPEAGGPPHLRGGPAKFSGKMGRGPGGRHGGGHGGWHGGMGMMKQADTNNDGAVSQAEFVAAALKRFDEQDANHDGKVTAAERQAARKEHREERKAKWEARKGQTEADKKAAK